MAPTRTTISAMRWRAPCPALPSRTQTFRTSPIPSLHSLCRNTNSSRPKPSTVIERTATTRTGFNIQQELPFNFTGQVGYVGSEGHHLFDREQVNLINPATGLRPLPQFAS